MARPRKRSSRGAVFVESILVVSFFAITFFGIIYFKELYLAKLRVQRAARASAISFAMGGCTGDPKAGLDGNIEKARASEKKGGSPPLSVDVPQQQASDAWSSARQARGGTALNETTQITVESGLSARNDATGRPNARLHIDVSSTSYVTCIDPTEKGGVTEIIPHVTSVFGTFIK